MMPERDADFIDRHAAITAILPQAGSLGWTAAARAAGLDHLFPGGTAELIDAYADYADARMIERAQPALAGKGLTGRVRALVAARIEAAEGERAALRRAMLFLARPGNLVLRTRLLARSTDRIWHAAGDISADFSWYTKRAILGTILSAVTLFSLQDGPGSARTLAFLDRQLAAVGQIGKIKARLGMGGKPAKPAGPDQSQTAAA